MKKARGRPRKKDALTTVIPIAISKDSAELLDRWAKANDLSRSAAVRMLVENGLVEFAASAAGRPRRMKKP
jgi:hypothetical protein